MRGKFFLALIISCVLLTTCKRSQKPDVFRITEVDVTPSFTSAEVHGMYEFNSVPKEMKVLYGKLSDMSDANSSVVDISGDEFDATINNIESDTKYYYCIECYASRSYTRSEIHSFITLKESVPVVETNAITNISLNSAVGGGNVVSSHGSEVIAKGICWSKTINPTIEDSCTNEGPGESIFVSKMNNLEPKTMYYVRAYATNRLGTGYGEEITFVTAESVGLPEVLLNIIDNVTNNSAICHGNVSFDGGAEVTDRGVCWSISPEPSIDDTYISAGSGEGSFPCYLTDLTSNTKYYVRAYAINSEGVSYSEIQNFTTLIDPQKPTVVTKTVDGITENAAVGGGNVTSDGGEDVTARGICWSTSQNPTISNNQGMTSNGTGVGEFSSNITGLLAGTTYYVRAYATNALGTSYGQEVSFTTSIHMELPTVATTEVTDITETSAVSGGNVESDGGAPVISRGVCWSTSQNPTTDSNEGMTTDGSGMGFFTSNLSNLAPETTYYVRAYATNVIGTQYGEQVSFTTNSVEVTLPEVITNVVANVTENSAECGSEVTSDGGAEVTARGVCWSTSQNPTIEDNEGMTTDGTGVGSFISNLSNLASQTTYYVRAYATNEVGTSYGEEKSFITLEEEEEEEVCEPDGEIDGYDYVDLGLPSGLKWATYNVGASSPEEYGNYYAWGETSTKSTYTESNSLTYGLSISQLQSQGYIDGGGNLTSSHDAATANWGGSWRIPTEEEMHELVDKCTWEWTTQGGVYGCKVTGPNGSCIFLPAAGWRYGSSLNGEGYRGYCWSSTPNDGDYDGYYAYGLYVDSDEEIVDYDGRHFGHTVRPVSGGNSTEPEATLPTVTTTNIVNITQTTAKGGGNVTSDGGATVTERGVCWSTSSDPTLNDDYVAYGSGTGSYTTSITGLMPNTTYYVRAYATNEVGTSYGEEKSFTTLEEGSDDGQEPTGYVDGHGYVDLGLPSGLMWSVCNLGAESSLDYGDYYAWGEITTKDEYRPDNSLTYGVEMSDISGNAQYDAVRANWGGIWRMPTEEEMEELQNVCTWEWVTYYNIPGYKVTGTNGNHIFLPAAGYYYYSLLKHEKVGGIYWGSTPGVNNSKSYYISFTSSNFDVYGLNRYDGINIRPVFTNETPEPEATLPTVTTDTISNITENSAECGSEVTSDGGAEVTARGVCWSTSQNPTIEDNEGMTTDGTGTGNFTSNLSNLASQTTYYVRAYATNEIGTSYGEEKSFTTLEEEEEEEGCEPDGEIDGYDYVDLGLPSGLKWATHNIGASSSEDYGDYFAWGETSPKAEYIWENSITCGEQMSDISGNAQYDAATANWGGGWRMPTSQEMQELVDHCEWEWTQVNGVYGSRVIGPNGSCIFLPAAGYRPGSSLYYEGDVGYYWSSTPIDDDYDDGACYLDFYSVGEGVYGSGRDLGSPVRPVSGGNSTEPEATLPTVTTDTISNITENSAECGSEVTSDGGATVTARGVCWSTSQNPTIDDNEGITTDGTGTGNFTSNLSNLASQTTYYVRAYATNEVGTSYGEEKSFITLEEEEEEEFEGETVIVNGVSFKMMKVNGGTFNMGAQSTDSSGTNYDSDAYSNESPVHSVTLSDYYIGETEVTQELWEAVMGSNPSHFSGYPQRPVEKVSWNDCQSFITKLNELTGKNFRLPTEAEWEYAARGGNESQGYKYSGSNTIDNVAWYEDNSSLQTHDVKTQSPNELGIYDMSGNVREWCQDWYDNYSSGSQTDPTGPLSGSDRVLRGGSWDYNAGNCRVSSRYYNHNGNGDEVIIGTAMDAHYTHPFALDYKNSWSEAIYFEEEIGMAGMITEISFYCTNPQSRSCHDLRIYMGVSDKRSQSSTNGWLPESELTLVYQGPSDLMLGAQEGWQTFELDEPFIYEGYDNLIVAVGRISDNYSYSQKWAYTWTDNAVLYRSNDYNSAYGQHPGNDSGYQSSRRANIKLEMSPMDGGKKSKGNGGNDYGFRLALQELQ